MRMFVTIIGLILMFAGLFIYAFWKQLGFHCPCPGSIFFAPGVVLFVSRRLFRKKAASKSDAPASP